MLRHLADQASSALCSDHIWYINSTPASSIKYGLDVLAPRYFGGAPDIVLTGVNQVRDLEQSGRCSEH